jgi:hypothetical protein
LNDTLQRATDRFNTAIAEREAAAAANATANSTANETSTAQEIDEAEDSWTPCNDVHNNGDGSWSLSGNPGAITDFVKSSEEHQTPVWVSATLEAPWLEYSPVV